MPAHQRLVGEVHRGFFQQVTLFRHPFQVLLQLPDLLLRGILLLVLDRVRAKMLLPAVRTSKLTIAVAVRQIYIK